VTDQNRGLYKKFIVTKADGSPFHEGNSQRVGDPNFFVLRLDDDGPYGAASRAAAVKFAEVIRGHNKLLADDLLAEVKNEENILWVQS
jgi:hypothetical protein